MLNLENLKNDLKNDMINNLENLKKSEENNDREKYIDILIKEISNMEKYEDLIKLFKWFIDFEITSNSWLDEKKNKLQQILAYKLLGDKKDEEEYEKKLEKEEIKKRTFAWKK